MQQLLSCIGFINQERKNPYIYNISEDDFYYYEEEVKYDNI